MSEFDKFNNLMQRLLTVPHAELKEKMDEYEKNKAKRKRAKVSRASSVSGAADH